LSSTISHWVRIKDGTALRDESPLPVPGKGTDSTPEAFYRSLQYAYPKFFKMDVLCKWGWLGAEALLTDGGKFVYEGIDKHKVAVVLATSSGCLDIDKKYQQSIINIPSPALFVYTLSNIVLGEICIRHGFKGEQACFVSECFDSPELHFWVNDLLMNRGMDACLCGWVDAVNYQHDVSMFWVVKNGDGVTFSPAAMQQLYNT
jgi:hypothetical protein